MNHPKNPLYVPPSVLQTVLPSQSAYIFKRHKKKQSPRDLSSALFCNDYQPPKQLHPTMIRRINSTTKKAKPPPNPYPPHSDI